MLAYHARKVLGKNALVVIAVSESLARHELDDARKQASDFGFDLIEIATDELQNPLYRANTGNRCFFCKATLFDHLSALKLQRSMPDASIVYGANLDDLDDVRPGHQAAKAAGALAPFVEVGLYKSEIRKLAEIAGLPSMDRPQAACLSSRFPINVTVDADRLKMVELAEEIVRAAGFDQIRVRYRIDEHKSAFAAIEIGQTELPRMTPQVVASLEAPIVSLGFSRIYVDPRGYRQGGAQIG